MGMQGKGEHTGKRGPAIPTSYMSSPSPQELLAPLAQCGKSLHALVHPFGTLLKFPTEDGGGGESIFTHMGGCDWLDHARHRPVHRSVGPCGDKDAQAAVSRLYCKLYTWDGG